MKRLAALAVVLGLGMGAYVPVRAGSGPDCQSYFLDLKGSHGERGTTITVPKSWRLKGWSGTARLVNGHGRTMAKFRSVASVTDSFTPPTASC